MRRCYGHSAALEFLCREMPDDAERYGVTMKESTQTQFPPDAAS